MISTSNLSDNQSNGLRRLSAASSRRDGNCHRYFATWPGYSTPRQSNGVTDSRIAASGRLMPKSRVAFQSADRAELSFLAHLGACLLWLARARRDDP
jgi:hypothetical protein